MECDRPSALTFEDLPNDLFVAEILPCLDIADLCKVSEVSHRLHDLATCDVLWMGFREKLFKRPETVTENLYQTYVGSLAEIEGLSSLFRRLPCVYTSFGFLFWLLFVIFFLAIVAVSILAGFGLPRDTVGFGAFVSFAVLSSAFLLILIGLIFGMEMWVWCYGLRMSRAYNRLQKDDGSGIVDDVSNRSSFANLVGSGSPEESEEVYPTYSIFQLFVWCSTLFPCFALAAFIPLGLRLIPGVENSRCSLLSFVIVAVIHEIILYVFAFKAGISTYRDARNALGTVFKIGAGGCCANCCAKICCLGFLVPVALAIDGAFSLKYLPVALIPLFLFLALLGFLFCYLTAVLGGFTAFTLWMDGKHIPSLCVGCSFCTGMILWCCCTLAFIVLVCLRFATALSFDVFWSMFPLWGTTGFFVLVVTGFLGILRYFLLDTMRKTAKRRLGEHADDSVPLQELVNS